MALRRADSGARWIRRGLILALVLMLGVLVLVGLAFRALSPDTSAARQRAEAQDRARMNDFVSDLSAIAQELPTDVQIKVIAARHSVDLYPIVRAPAAVTINTAVGAPYAGTVAKLCFQVSLTRRTTALASPVAPVLREVLPCPNEPYIRVTATPAPTATR